MHALFQQEIDYWFDDIEPKKTLLSKACKNKDTDTDSDLDAEPVMQPVQKKLKLDFGNTSFIGTNSTLLIYKIDPIAQCKL